MTLAATAVGLVQALIAGVAAVVGYVAWSYRNKPGGLPLFVMSAAATLYAALSALSASVTDPVVWEVASALLYPLTAAIGAGALYLGIDFTGRDIAAYPSVVAVLVWQVLIGTGIAVTAPEHSLLFTDYAVAPAGLTDVGYGPFVWANTLISLVVVLSGITLLAVELAGAKGLYREQTAAIVVSGLLGTGFFLWEVLAPIHPTFNLATVGVVGWCAATLWGVFRFDLLETSPVAEETLIDSIDAAVFVLDTDRGIVDLNAGAQRLLDIDPGAIGVPVDEALDNHPRVVAAITGDDPGGKVVVGDEDRAFEVEVFPVHRTYSRPGPVADRRRIAGWTVLVKDVTERKRRERRLERQNERLDQFASVVSHDLRNPLNVAKGRVELAKADADVDVEHLDAALSAHDRMETLIDNLLTLARSDGSVGETEPVDLSTVCRECWQRTATTAASLEVRTEQTVLADTSRLRQLIENLLRNSVEHGGKDVVVTVGDLPNGFYVADDGPGIPADERDRVFESGRSLSANGTGLGLAIVQRTAADHGWEVEAVAADGGGARFEITRVETA